MSFRRLFPIFQCSGGYLGTTVPNYSSHPLEENHLQCGDTEQSYSVWNQRQSALSHFQTILLDWTKNWTDEVRRVAGAIYSVRKIGVPTEHERSSLEFRELTSDYNQTLVNKRGGKKMLVSDNIGREGEWYLIIMSNDKQTLNGDCIISAERFE